MFLMGSRLTFFTGRHHYSTAQLGQKVPRKLVTTTCSEKSSHVTLERLMWKCVKKKKKGLKLIQQLHQHQLFDPIWPQGWGLRWEACKFISFSEFPILWEWRTTGGEVCYDARKGNSQKLILGHLSILGLSWNSLQTLGFLPSQKNALINLSIEWKKCFDRKTGRHWNRNRNLRITFIFIQLTLPIRDRCRVVYLSKSDINLLMMV